jgi:hypothetical protein
LTVLASVELPSVRADDVFMAAEPDRVLTPELVLIDPELANGARASLPAPSDTLAEIRLRVLTGGGAQRLPLRSDVHLRDGSLGDSTGAPRFAASSLSAVATACIAVLVAPLLVAGSTSDTFRSMTPPDTRPTPDARSPRFPALGDAPVRQAPEEGPSSINPSAQGSPAGQRFAWAPVTGADGYSVEIFSASVRVFASTTTRPELQLPERWRHDGRLRRLVPGEYRWYVWPLVNGRRGTQAVVQASLHVPSS